MTTFQSVHSTPIKQKLLDGLKRIVATNLDLPLVPIGNNKQPLGDRWQQRPFTASQLIEAIEGGGVSVPIKGKTKKIQPLGFGLITGRSLTIQGNSHFLMALDQDGGSARRKIDELSEGISLPQTVAFTSDRPGRCQYLFLVPEQYADVIKTKKIKIGTIGDDGKAEQLEFRWQRLQSVLPPSVHPLTGEYRWVDGCAIDEIDIAIAPDWIIEQMLIEPSSLGSRGASEQGSKRAALILKDTPSDKDTASHREQESFTTSELKNSRVEKETHRVPVSSYHSSTQKTTFSNFSTSRPRWNDIDFALSYLDAVSSYRADDYDEWLAVGMALHSIDEELLDSWDKWSSQSAKYKSGDCERKWRSFSPGGGVTLGTLAHIAKQDGWQSPFGNKNTDWSSLDKDLIISDRQGSYSAPRSGSLRDRQKHQTKNATVTDDNYTGSDTSKVELLSFEATVTTVTDVLKAGLTDYAERDRLDATEARSVISKAAFWQMVAAIRTSLDEIQPEDTAQFNRLIDWHDATLDFDKILPQHLAEAFNRDAAILNIDPVSLWQYFLPTVLSLAGKRVSLDVESHSLPAIAWTCIVGESGTGKSRAESVILGNLKQKQQQEKKRWLEQIQEYKQITQSKSKNDDTEIESPAPERKYLFEVATIQAVMRRLSEQRENGSIWARDEIAGLFKSLGQFQGKKGDNEGLECLLKMWDGSGSFVDRVNAETDSYAVPETRLSIAGGIQPGAFRTAFKDPHDAQGLQARFLYAIPQVFPAKRVKGYCQLSDILPPMYDWLDQCPVGKIKLSLEADRRYSNLVEQIGLQAEQSSCPAVRAWMRKLPTQMLRIALGLHLVECYYNRDLSFGELQLATLERAVEVCRYYRSAFALVREKTADSDNMSSILLKMWDMATINPDGVTPRELYRGIKALGRRAKQTGRSVGAYTIELINKLVQMGKGTLEKNGRSMRFKATFNPPDNPTPATSIQDESKLSIPVENLEPIDNSLDSVTEVTKTQSKQSHELEPSPLMDVSPVTSTKAQKKVEDKTNKINSNTSSNENINWSLQFLSDLELTPAPHQRFTSFEQIENLLNELEQRQKNCYDELLKKCPNYMERIITALETVSRYFYSSASDHLKQSI